MSDLLRLSNCSVTGCKNDGEYIPQIVLPVSNDGMVITLNLDALVCERCIKLPRRAYLSDNGWQALSYVLRKRGYPVPNKNDCKLQFKAASGSIIIPHTGIVT